MACNCEEGYEYNPNTGLCESTNSETPIFSGTEYTVVGIVPSNAFGWLGAVFYENIDNLNYPINTQYFSSTGTTLVLATPNPGSYTLVIENTIINNFWGDVQSPDTANGRLNDAGIWGYTDYPTNNNPIAGTQPLEWIGFTACIEVPETKEYYIAFAADNNIRIRLNDPSNVVFLFNSCTATGHFQKLHVFPITLQQGTNILYVEGSNCTSLGGMVVEVYDATYAQLAAVTNESELDNYILFSTKNRINTPFDIGSQSGYTCPQGFLLSNCTGELTCQELSFRELEPCPFYKATNCFSGLEIFFYLEDPTTIVGHTQGLNLQENSYVYIEAQVNLCINIGYTDGQTSNNDIALVLEESDMIHDGRPVYILEFNVAPLYGLHYIIWNEELERWELWESYSEELGFNCKACCLNNEFGIQAPWYVLNSNDLNTTEENQWEFIAGEECAPFIQLTSVNSSSLCAEYELVQITNFINCWTIEEQPYRIVELNQLEVIANYESCDTCYPGINYPLGEACDIIPEVEINNLYFKHCNLEKLTEIKCSFSDAVYQLYQKYKYGITVCCEKDLDALIVKNKIADFELIKDPNLCNDVCEDEVCEQPCSIDVEINLPQWQSCPSPTNIDVNISIE